MQWNGGQRHADSRVRRKSFDFENYGCTRENTGMHSEIKKNSPSAVV